MINNLKQARKDANLSLQALGDMCGISKSHMHELEKDAGSTPTLTTVYSIAKALNKSVYDIWPAPSEINQINELTAQVLNEIEKEKLERIAYSAEIIVRDYWKYINEDSAKEELKDAVYDYKGWVESK